MPADAAVEYVGFWARVLATLIDTVLVLCVTLPLVIAVYGRSYFDVSKSGFIVGPADFIISCSGKRRPERWPFRLRWSMPGPVAG